jgi:endonuclease-3 related protein
MLTGESRELYVQLEKLDLLKKKPLLWWPAYGTFEVVVGAVLTQNTKWENVEKSLRNLRDHALLVPKALAAADLEILMRLIQPSGFYRNKAGYLKRLAHAIVEHFGDFDRFCTDVDREWLMVQKGVGPETADSILCYACGRAVMVVDAYTARVLAAFGYEFESYDALQSWCAGGMADHYPYERLPEVYARFHGMIVEYVKANSRGRKVDISLLL